MMIVEKAAVGRGGREGEEEEARKHA